jgi:hypothetical protein
LYLTIFARGVVSVFRLRRSSGVLLIAVDLGRRGIRGFVTVPTRRSISEP